MKSGQNQRESDQIQFMWFVAGEDGNPFPSVWWEHQLKFIYYSDDDAF